MEDRYPALSQGRQDAYGAATSRAEAQVLRLSALYAALDCSGQVEASHLHAALAVWDYCQASARLFFNDAPIDPTARRISEAITAAAPEGLSKDQIRGLFHGHVSKERIDLALQQLQTLGVIGCPPPARARTRPPLHHLGPRRRRQRCPPRELTRITRLTRTLRREKADTLGVQSRQSARNPRITRVQIGAPIGPWHESKKHADLYSFSERRMMLDLPGVTK